jgi:hypothetical protein
VTIEQVWSRWDPRRRALAVTWQWYARVQSNGELTKYFGSNPFLYTDDLGDTWRQADGTPVRLPLTYASASDPKVSPWNHLSLAQTTKWYPRDLGFAPDGTPWLVLPAENTNVVRLFYWDGSAWESSILTENLGEGDPLACGTTRDFLLCAYSEQDNPGQLRLRISEDSGRTWSSPVVANSLGTASDGSEQRIDWVSFAQPADDYRDNMSRFFVGYHRASDGSLGRRFKNNIRWVRVDIGGTANRSPTITVTSPIDAEVYAIGEGIDLDAITDDPDGDPVSVSWTANGDPVATPWLPKEGSYTVVAVADDGNGARSSDAVTIIVAQDPAPAVAPDAPVMDPPLVKRTTVRLTWSDVPNEAGYEIGRWRHDLASKSCRSLRIFKTVEADVTTTWNTIKKGGSFCYAVRAFNGVGVSAWSNLVQATLEP